MNLLVIIPKTHSQRPINVRKAVLLLFILLLSSAPMGSFSEVIEEQADVEWIKFDLPKDTIRNFVGTLDNSLALEDRSVIAHSRLGIHDSKGTLFNLEIPEELLVTRPDLALILISNDHRFAEVRLEIDELQGVEVREFIAPSGLLVQGTQFGLNSLKDVVGVSAIQPVPLAMMVDEYLMHADLGAEVRIESWRGEGLLPGVDISDTWNMRLHQGIESVANEFLEGTTFAETGRYDGITIASIADIVAEPSVAWIGEQPKLTNWNDQARNHMNINAMRSYYTTDLDGSGQIVAVADSGLDADHGDFGSRVIASVDLIGDGSTADAHSGHGTHVSCTVLGDGSRGTYSGVAPEAELYFQAMENDNNGNFQWSSINNMLNTAYNQGARIHTNSWGSSSSNDWGKYTASSEDVDDRTRYYDQYYSGREGYVVLFAAGNDGPDSGTVGAPGTAKNTITVGNSQNRYQGSPNSIMDGSSRGPVDDGRIKPDIIAPGGYVRSCRAQEATDIAGATWSNSWYLEYTGTSMATPNAAGTAALIREYITEISQRPEPQGALVKALMILGARDVGTRDIPNMDEGWGRIDLRGTLAPSNGRGIWVDDRSVLSSSGNSKSYNFNITSPGQGFKAVLAWSDERGSRFSNTQLVNNLNLLVTTPSGVEYKGNEFSQGRSIQGGIYDTLNNVEVVLIDSAEAGIWTVKVTDSQHSGTKAQPYAIAVSGIGVNDLRPDPAPILTSFSTDIAIPQVGDDVLVEMEISNLGNVKAENVEVQFQEEGQVVDTQTFDLGPGGSRILFFDWQPQVAGARTLSFVVDGNDLIDEINEANNQVDIIVNVTTPGVRIESDQSEVILTDINATSSSWQIKLTNTALLSTNATITSVNVQNPDGDVVPWYVGFDIVDFELNGQQSASINVTLVHPKGPDPGLYDINLLGIDEDNSVSSPYTLVLDVPVLSMTRIEFDYTKIPVHPQSPTTVDVRLFNQGNDNLGYDVFLTPPPGWYAGFDDLSAQGGANSASTGLMLEDDMINMKISFTPPSVMTLANTELTVLLQVVSQTEENRMFEYDLPIIVIPIANLTVDLETSIGTILPDSTFSLQYTLENRGNIDLNLQPRLQLPLGWIQNTQLDEINLSWTDSLNLQVSVTASSEAKSGKIEFILDSAEFSWSNSVNVSIVKLPDPILTFASVEIGGETWSNIFGSGKHPSGVPINYTWLVENRGESTWTPDVILSLSQDLFGDCENLPSIGIGEIVPLKCTILISATAAPMSEPEFSILLEDDFVSLNRTTTMLVAETKEVSWKVLAPSKIETGQPDAVQITITNQGNVRLTSAINILPPSGWTVKFDGLDSIDIEAGQSQIVRLEVIAKNPGTETVVISLSDEGIINPSTDIEMTSEGEVILDDKSNINLVIISGISVIILLFMAIALFKSRSKRQEYEVPKTQVTISTAAPPTAAIQCFSCRLAIEGPMLGCSNCGARYHSACSVANCVHCNADKSALINAS